jgi:hypothetical protein
MRTAVDLAVLAVQGSPSVMDLPMTDFDPSPTVLDLPEKEDGQPCSRCSRPAVDTCPACGSPLCEDCAGSPDQDGESGGAYAGVAADHAEGTV